ncbi:methyltransferase family protein [Georgenia thermotolerans]|uniref:Isoprenylcysteine carboxylmethyltransferase family protein n=1 Tax=Georgenia thermotolerans TaxID=527326 RepID=A0A7J5UPW0_9MICO|nr:isoprenylcysteine carboxylmethyltransferase family protein [Georgenia thermotolerans]KAE8764458.1 isoprenylcysteine carboxylmethyltransferase family protein [Georgenia thermotolerans]
MDRSDALVAAQVVALGGAAWPGRPRWSLPPALTATAGLLVLGGGGLAVAGALPHGRHLSPRVAPPPTAELVTTGAYALTRNPIYTGLTAATLGFAVLRRRAAPLLWAAILAGVLTRKARLEEAALEQRFGARYRAYAAGTPRLLPRLRRRTWTEPV